jgi:hypothetical protein
MDCRDKPGNDDGDNGGLSIKNGRAMPGHLIFGYAQTHACEMNFVFI